MRFASPKRNVNEPRNVNVDEGLLLAKCRSDVYLCKIPLVSPSGAVLLTSASGLFHTSTPFSSPFWRDVPIFRSRHYFDCLLAHAKQANDQYRDPYVAS